ncbi:diguanylate cyclase [Paraglaciecola sp.]|uniref:diguanylate cyclase n=1 Tax=Paraglaciecola sp. TaxID=1920173 RepID=UPI00273E37FD|nr:diguanylate cyclase [Paraglaciecola sp.]MDP5031347.1 diguanylate cyclase [Paraglaciecola sp.]
MPLGKFNEDAEVDLSHSKILVVDDQPINIQTVYNILAEDYEVLAATSAIDALEVCQANPPDLILLDVLMPGMTGLELCQMLKQKVDTRDIPVIFVTSFNEQEEEDECWRSGGIDFITKPVNPMTVKNRVKAHLTLKFQKDILLKLVYVDGLTSIFNRRYFDKHFEKIRSEVKRSQRDTALLMIDIDYFKLFNDNYGHVAGDDTLKKVALIIQRSLSRPADFVSRYGGEEFIAVLPDTDIEGATIVAERIRQNVFNEKIENAHSPQHCVSVSIGISTILNSAKHNCDATEDADKHLYLAKKSGRNQIHYPATE